MTLIAMINDDLNQLSRLGTEGLQQPLRLGVGSQHAMRNPLYLFSKGATLVRGN